MPTDRQRRETERRRAVRQLEARRARAVRRRRVNLIMSVVGTLVLVGAIVAIVVATNDNTSKPAAKSPSSSGAASAVAGSKTGSAASSASTSAAPAYPCDWKKAGTAAKKVTVPPTTRPTRTGTVAATVRTTQGTLTLALNRAAAPCAVESFVSLAAQKYFDNTPCHRLTSAATLHVLQCGDPTGTGSGGPGYQFGDELTGKEKYTRGLLAMANAGANTNGSQFFIVYGASTLQPAYTVFGRVTKGLDVVDKVVAKGSNPATDGKPKLAISITGVTVG